MRTVAIYARVSTEHEAQLSALGNQVQYYENILAQHPDWILYDKYIDEGITGTSTKKRKRFMAMMEDARKGCFDLIITREVSRFARNTVDTLQETRKLRRLGVEVYFTEDNIWTMNDEDGELRLTIMATLAQNESKKTSLRVKAGQKVSFENGVLYGNGNILGYNRVGHELIQDPEQAETVRLIFELYAEGMGARALTYKLEQMGRKTSMGLTRWQPGTITRIIKNPFYYGMIEYRKQYVPDYLEQKKINNFGDVEKIYVMGKHQPIISKELFDKAQEVLNSKTSTIVNRGKTGKRVSDSVWSRKLKCECGSNFQKRMWHKAKDGKKQFCFQCYSTIRTGTISTRLAKGLSIEGICGVPAVQEWKLQLMLKVIIQKLWTDKKKTIELLDQILQEALKDDPKEAIRRDIEKKNSIIEGIIRKRDSLLELRLDNEISAEAFKKKSDELTAQENNLRSEMEYLKIKEKTEVNDVQLRIENLRKTIEQKVEYDMNNLPDSVIDRVVKQVVVSKNRFIWYISCSMDQIDCSVDGKNQHPELNMQLSPSLRGTSTGCYSRRKELILNEVGLYLLSLEITEDDVIDMNENTSYGVRLAGYESMIVELYI